MKDNRIRVSGEETLSNKQKNKQNMLNQSEKQMYTIRFPLITQSFSFLSYLIESLFINIYLYNILESSIRRSKRYKFLFDPKKIKRLVFEVFIIIKKIKDR